MNGFVSASQGGPIQTLAADEDEEPPNYGIPLCASAEICNRAQAGFFKVFWGVCAYVGTSIDCSRSGTRGERSEFIATLMCIPLPRWYTGRRARTR